MAGPRDHLVDRTHADDLAGRDGNFLAHAAPQKLADRLLDAQELSRQIDAEDLVPLLEGHVDGARVALDAGVGDEDVDRPERLQRLLEERLDIVRLRDIGLNDDRLAAFVFDRLGGRCAPAASCA